MEDTLDLGYLFGVLKKHLLFVVLIGIIAAAAGFSVSNFLIPKKCKARLLKM